MRVIQSVGSLAPETGGPARSVGNLAASLADLGVEVTILTQEFGKGYSDPLIPDHKDVQIISVPAKYQIGMRSIIFPGYRDALKRLCSSSQDLIIHDHGIWLPQNYLTTTFAAKNGIPLVISPRGMLEKNALQFSYWRKKIAWHLYQKRNLESASAIHATSDMESSSVRAIGLKNKIINVPNGTVIPDILEKSRGSKGDRPLKMLFLSRIHPKKGLIDFMQSLALVNLPDWELLIAGYDEGGHLQKVLDAAIDWGIRDQVQYVGEVDNESKWDVYRDADLFVLPSLTENFGIVIAEALASELPVITTTGTPWEDIISNHCGWWVEPTVISLAEAVKEALTCDRSQLVEMGKNGRDLVKRKYSWPAVAQKMKSSYEVLLSTHRYNI